MMVGDGGDPWSGGGPEQVGPEQFTRFLRHPQPGSGLCQLYAISSIVHRCELLLFLALIS